MDDDFSSSSRRPSTSTTASGSSDHSSSGPSSPASFAELHLFNLDDADFHMDGSGISGVLADDLDFEADVPTPKVTYSRHRRQTSPTLADMLSAEVWAEHEKGGEPAVQDWVSSRFATLVTFLCEADTLTGESIRVEKGYLKRWMTDMFISSQDAARRRTMPAPRSSTSFTLSLSELQPWRVFTCLYPDWSLSFYLLTTGSRRLTFFPR